MAKKRESGGGRLRRQEKSLIWVSPTVAEKERIRTAAGIEGVPMSKFLLGHGLAAAEKILEKFRKQS